MHRHRIACLPLDFTPQLTLARARAQGWQQIEARQVVSLSLPLRLSTLPAIVLSYLNLTPDKQPAQPGWKSGLLQLFPQTKCLVHR